MEEAENERASVDGLSDEEEIEFANAFDALSTAKTIQQSPRKKLKKKASLPNIVCRSASSLTSRAVN